VLGMPALIVRRAMMRGALFWVGLRVLMLLVGGAARSATDQPTATGLESHPLLFVLIIACLAWYDLWRRNEVIFLANLGISLRYAVACYVAPAFLFETLPALFA